VTSVKHTSVHLDEVLLAYPCTESVVFVCINIAYEIVAEIIIIIKLEFNHIFVTRLGEVGGRLNKTSAL